MPFYLLIQNFAELGQSVDEKKSDFQDGGRHHLKFYKISIFGHVTVIRFNIWYNLPSSIKIGRFFTEIWRFNHFSKWRPCAILDFKNLQFLSCSPCRHAVLLPHNNVAEIGQSVDELWPKKRFSRWQPPPSWIIKKSIFGHDAVFGCNIWCSIPSFIKIGRFFTEICRFNDFQNGGRPPSWILKMCSFCHAARIDMPFCFLIQNFAEIGQSIDELWPKKPILKMAAAAILNFKNFNFWSRDCHRVHYLL